MWKRLNHPNILLCYGASMNASRFCVVSPWVENGDVLSYTRKNPETNRLRLVSLIEQQTTVELNNGYLAADRCNQWPCVPSQNEFSTRGHSRGMRCCHGCISSPLLKAYKVKYPGQRWSAPASSSWGLRHKQRYSRPFFTCRGVRRLDCARTFDSW